MYYAIGHFSKFIPPGSVRIDSRLMRAGLADLSTKLEYAAFLTPEQAIVVIVLNKSNSRYPLNIRDTHGSANAQKIINERSITTFIWQPFGVKPQHPISVQGVKATPYGPAKGGVLL
uniref:Glucosylceramidase n=1 Tax=Rhipicephalus zambeziensis TaxID=60191 RepID=A0A224YQD6_9ACAR